MTVSLWHDEGTGAAPWHADVVIIGAGITGAATALALRDTGLDVVVVERGDPAAGATGRTAGFLTCGSVAHFARQREAYGDDTALLLRGGARDAILHMLDVVEAEGIACDVDQRGSWTTFETEDGLAGVKEAAELLVASGFPLELADEATLHERLGASGLVGGYHDPVDAGVDPVRLVRGLLTASGVRVLGRTAVRRLRFVQKKVEVLTTAGPIVATRVVLATNALAPELHPWVAAHVRPVRGQLIATAAVDAFLEAPTFLSEAWAHARQLPDGRVIVGGQRHIGGEDEEAPGDALHPGIQRALEDIGRRVFPALEWTAVEYRWSGTMGFTPDGLPAIGHLPDAPRVIFAGGYNGHGMAWGWQLGHLAAALLLGDAGLPDAIDLARFATPGPPSP